MSVSFPLLSLTRTSIIGLRAHLRIQDDLTSRSLITSAKTFFPNEETLTGSGYQAMSICLGGQEVPPFNPLQKERKLASLRS